MSYSMYRYQLLVDSTFPDENYFSLIKSKFELGSPYQHKDKYYFFKEIELNEHYFSAHLLFGDNNKYSPDVVYLEDNTLGPNPKKRNQIEPFNEIFIVYIFLENDLLLSTYNNSGLIKEILKFQKNDIVIKNKFVDVDTFIENITRLTEVKLFLDDNLFSDSEPLTRELNNYFGFDANNQYEISAKVNAPISNKIKNKIRSLNQKKSTGQINSLVCVGKDDNGISTYLNNETFNKKLNLEVNADENGHHDYREIISAIKKIYNI